MGAHGSKRSHPDELVPGTLRVVSLRMDYLPGDTHMAQRLAQPEKAYISRYALGRDYHKLIRKRVQQLAERIQAQIGPFGFRAFVDSAPVLEKAIAEKAGLGWIGKNTLVLNRKAGSYFFLSELFVDVPLPVDPPHVTEHCGRCTACLDICPTNAFVGPYVLDARRCISYLTIELKSAIPEDLRPLIGNRVFGCDDCQIVCPWNRFARTTAESDFKPRHNLDNAQLAELFMWDEEKFLSSTEGSPLRRAGYERWLRNGGRPGQCAIEHSSAGSLEGAPGLSVGAGARTCGMGAEAARRASVNVVVVDELGHFPVKTDRQQAQEKAAE